MTSAICLATALLLTACAGVPLPCAIPPAAYDYEPTKPYVVLEIPLRDVNSACRQNGTFSVPGKVIACTLLFRQQAIVIVPMVEWGHATAADQACLRREEGAHVNGWGQDHSG